MFRVKWSFPHTVIWNCAEKNHNHNSMLAHIRYTYITTSSAWIVFCSIGSQRTHSRETDREREREREAGRKWEREGTSAKWLSRMFMFHLTWGVCKHGCVAVLQGAAVRIWVWPWIIRGGKSVITAQAAGLWVWSKIQYQNYIQGQPSASSGQFSSCTAQASTSHLFNVKTLRGKKKSESWP